MSVGRCGIDSCGVVAAVCRDHAASPIAATTQRAARSLAALAAIVPILATLAACAPSPLFRNTAQIPQTQTRQASLILRTPPSTIAGHDSVVRKPAAVATHPPAPARSSSYGVASFYNEDEWTASGEKFDTHALTAAHPTLPFGTRLRVTNVTNGRSVVVRINDRGPFVHGRVVDLSESAAESLGMVERGIAKVKLDVVQKQSSSTASPKQF